MLSKRGQTQPQLIQEQSEATTTTTTLAGCLGRASAPRCCRPPCSQQGHSTHYYLQRTEIAKSVFHLYVQHRRSYFM